MRKKVVSFRFVRRKRYSQLVILCLAVSVIWHKVTSNALYNYVGSQVELRDTHLDFSPLHVHFVMRTYDKATISATANFGSILAAASVARGRLELSIAILDTSQDLESDNLHTMLMSTIHTLSKAMGQSLDVAIRTYVHEGPESFGYVATDIELSRIKSLHHPPDYVIFCNGDTYYAQEFFASTLPFMLQNVDLIGVNWVPTMRHVPAQEDYATKVCKFEHGGVDLNGVLINVKALIRANASFAARKTPCKNMDAEFMGKGCRAVEIRPYFAADWGLFSQLLDHPETSHKCVAGRPLFLQN